MYVSLCVCNPSCAGTLLHLEYDEFPPIVTAIKSGLSGTAVEIRQLELRVFKHDYRRRNFHIGLVPVIFDVWSSWTIHFCASWRRMFWPNLVRLSWFVFELSNRKHSIFCLQQTTKPNQGLKHGYRRKLLSSTARLVFYSQFWIRHRWNCLDISYLHVYEKCIYTYILI